MLKGEFSWFHLSIASKWRANLIWVMLSMRLIWIINIEKAFHYFYRLRKSNIYSKHLRKVAHLNQPKSAWIQCLFYTMAIHMFGFDYDCHLALSSVDSSSHQPNMMLLLLIKKKKNFTKDYPTSGYKTPSTVSLLAILNLLLAFEFLLVEIVYISKAILGIDQFGPYSSELFTTV